MTPEKHFDGVIMQKNQRVAEPTKEVPSEEVTTPGIETKTRNHML